MIEMLGVLAIIGVLSVGGIAGYSKAMHRYRVNKTIEQITLITGNIKTFFAPQKSYNGLTTGTATVRQLLKKAKLVPDEMWEESNIDGSTYYLSHPFGGAFAIGSTSSCPNYTCDVNDNFSLYFYGIPSEACIDILSQDLPQIGINAVFLDNLDFSDDEVSVLFPLPQSMDKIVKLCTIKNADHVNFYLYVADITKNVWPGDLAADAEFINNL